MSSSSERGHETARRNTPEGSIRRPFDKLCGLLRYVDRDYKDAAIFEAIRKELDSAGWQRYIGKRGRMKTFGLPAPLKELQRKFGFIPESIVTAAKEQVAQGR